MIASFLRTAAALALPGGWVFLAAIGFLRPRGLPQWLQPPIGALPYIVLTFGMVFGWYLASNRVMLSLLILGLADRAVVLFPPDDPDPASTGRILFAAVSFLVPVNLLGLSLVKEEAISTLRGVLRLAVVLVQPFAVLWLAMPDQTDLARSLQRALVPVDLPWTALTQPALMAFFGAIVLLGVRFVMDRNPLDAGSLWAVIASFTALQGLRYSWSPTNFFSTAGLILFFALVQASHRRAYRDELTGLLGKAAYDQAVAQLKGRYVLAVVGLDQLKQYGNQHGRPVSEQILRLLAPKIETAAGPGQVYRVSGEDLTLLFPRRTATDTLVVMDAVRKAVEQCRLELRGGTRVWETASGARPRAGADALLVTASIGMAEGEEGQRSLSLVTKAAYRALYEAKSAGGNLVRRGSVAAEPAKTAPRETGRIVAYSEFEY